MLDVFRKHFLPILLGWVALFNKSTNATSLCVAIMQFVLKTTQYFSHVGKMFQISEVRQTVQNILF